MAFSGMGIAGDMPQGRRERSPDLEIRWSNVWPG
jgi:hypothetical protein